MVSSKVRIIRRRLRSQGFVLFYENELGCRADLQEDPDVELNHHKHGVDAQHVPQAVHLDAVAAVKVGISPLTVTQHNDTFVPARQGR